MVRSPFIEEIPCEEGETLYFYRCFHSDEWILTIFMSPQ